MCVMEARGVRVEGDVKMELSAAGEGGKEGVHVFGNVNGHTKGA